MLLVFAPTVSAQGPTVNAYGGAGQVAAEVTTLGASSGPTGGAPAGETPTGAERVLGDSTNPTAASRLAPASTPASAPAPAPASAAKADVQKLNADSLPFTGFDLLLMLGGGVLLLSIGVGIRQLVRDPI